jgi:excisionase family DNA binding protein
MNKLEVATALNCSTRQVEKYASENRLGTVEYVRGKRGNVASYKAEEVERLKVEIAKGQGEVVGHAAPSVALSTQRGAQVQALALVEQLTSGLDRQHADAERIIAALESLKATAAPNGNEPHISLTDKLTLSLTEAALLAGLSRHHLRAAIEAKKLKARILGRGWRVKRSDLDSYVSKL